MNNRQNLLGARPFRLRALAAMASFLLPCALAHADVYKCTDAEGAVTYTNQKSSAKGCKLLSQDHASVNSVPVPAARPSSGGNSPVASGSPASFPKVAPETQKNRDNLRRRTLDQELAAEQKNHETAQHELAAQEAIRNGDERNYQKYLDRIQSFKDRVADHQRNIEALNKEIANLK